MAAICVFVRDQLEALVDGEVRGVVGLEVREHLAACAECRAHYTEAASLPARLAALGGPEPPPALITGVLRRVGGFQLTPLQLWGPLAVEMVLFLIALWYVSGLDGLYDLIQGTAVDAGTAFAWAFGQANVPAPPLEDMFLLVVCALLLITTLYHLALLSRRGLQSP